MSKPVKELIMRDYQSRFSGIDGALVIDIRGIDANDTNEMRIDLLGKGVRVTVVKNALARKAFEGGDLEALGPALTGPSALAYGGETVVNVARAIVDWAKKLDQIQLKGAVLDGQYFDGEAGVRRLSDFPTKEEAQAKVVQLVLSPGANILGAAKGGGGRILGIVKQIQEKLEKGESIARVG